MKKNTLPISRLWLIFVLAILIVALVSAIFYVDNVDDTTVIPDVAYNTSVDIPVDSVKTTKNWEEYSDPKLQFSFKHPSSLQPLSDTSYTGDDGKKVEVSRWEDEKSHFVFTVNVFKKGQTPKVLRLLTDNTGNYLVYNEKKYEIFSSDDGMQHVVGPYERGDFVYVLAFASTYRPDAVKGGTLFNTIVSTFNPI